MKSAPSKPQAAAANRAAVIDGHATLPAAPTAVLLPERPSRFLILAHVSQLIYHPGSRNPYVADSPWYVRCDGQEIGISAASAERIAAALHLNLSDLCAAF